MSKKITVLLIILSLFGVLFTTYVFADENEVSDETTEVTSNEVQSISATDLEEDSEEESTEEVSTSSTSTDSTSTDISSYRTVTTLAEANLSLNNILNIILIALGILMILFAIAILIRLKSEK